MGNTRVYPCASNTYQTVRTYAYEHHVVHNAVHYVVHSASNTHLLLVEALENTFSQNEKHPKAVEKYLSTNDIFIQGGWCKFGSLKSCELFAQGLAFAPKTRSRAVWICEPHPVSNVRGYISRLIVTYCFILECRCFPICTQYWINNHQTCAAANL